MMNISDNYDGMGFDQEAKLRAERNLLRFSGSMIDESAAGLTVTIGLENTTAEVKDICLFPGDLVDVEMIAQVIGKTGVLMAGTAVQPSGVTVKSNTCLEYAQKFFAKNPTRITELQISVSDEAQLANAIEITQSSPFRRLGSQNLIPKSSQRAGDANTKLVNIPLKNFQLDDQTQMFIRLGGNQTAELTFFIGASRNDAYMLQESAKLATI